MALVQHNAAQLVRDSDAKTDLIPKLKALLNDEATKSIMQQALSRLAIKDADERIATTVIALASRQLPADDPKSEIRDPKPEIRK
jgi:UDP-N-acetylglucosamine--N-acetylmuramyl-(pentapeptide) pyrophosphoryl-undecaprenol N-acetylglucosamine transferase